MRYKIRVIVLDLKIITIKIYLKLNLKIIFKIRCILPIHSFKALVKILRQNTNTIKINIKISNLMKKISITNNKTI